VVVVVVVVVGRAAGGVEGRAAGGGAADELGRAAGVAGRDVGAVGLAAVGEAVGRASGGAATGRAAGPWAAAVPEDRPINARAAATRTRHEQSKG